MKMSRYTQKTLPALTEEDLRDSASLAETAEPEIDSTEGLELADDPSRPRFRGSQKSSRSQRTSQMRGIANA